MGVRCHIITNKGSKYGDHGTRKIPQVIGAEKVVPARRVVSMTGDGGFLSSSYGRRRISGRRRSIVPTNTPALASPCCQSLPTPSQGPNAMKAAPAPVLAMMSDGERPTLAFTQWALEQPPPAADIWQD
jgi:hypothetical protein